MRVAFDHGDQRNHGHRTRLNENHVPQPFEVRDQKICQHPDDPHLGEVQSPEESPSLPDRRKHRGEEQHADQQQ